MRSALQQLETENHSRTMLCIGHGYCARELSQLLMKEPGWRIVGTTRSDSNVDRIAASGIECRVWPGSDLEQDLRKITHLLISAAPDENGDAVLNLLGKSLHRYARNVEWIGYLSTTAVYGDRNGEWVDEEATLSPSTERGRRRVEAERGWQRFSRETEIPLHVFRIAGIYGPGRGPIEQLLRGKDRQVVRKGQVFNRIHVADIANLLRASIDAGKPGSVYNVCDDLPAPPEDVVDYAAGLLGLEPPVRVELSAAKLSPMARSFYGESKRVCNEKIKRELCTHLKHPDFRSGLDALALEREGQSRHEAAR